MSYRGHTQGEVIILKEPLPVPDGTEVEILIPPARIKRGKVQGKLSVTAETFGLIPSDPATVRAVLEEELYET